MIQLIFLGFFVCLGAKAGMDLYDSGKKFITKAANSEAVHDGIEAVKKGAHKAHEKVDSTLNIHKDEHKKEGSVAKA